MRNDSSKTELYGKFCLVQLKKWMPAKCRCIEKGSAVFAIIYDRYILAGLLVIMLFTQGAHIIIFNEALPKKENVKFEKLKLVKNIKMFNEITG